MKTLDYRYVNLTDGFWKQKQQLNRKITINAVWDRFYETGRITAFNCNWKEGEPQKPHFFWDSDVAKWLEAAAYILKHEKDEVLEQRIEMLIDCIEKNQGEDGYFNIYFTVCEPQKRFSDRNMHELYCAGHLFEAAVAYYEATGKDRLLKLMEKYADYIERVFVKEESAAFVTPGHEEIELALVRMFRCTGKKKFLDLAKFFLDKRGANDKDTEIADFTLKKYCQSHLPVRKLRRAEGHCVRALYLYSAMADVAFETGDTELLEACKALFEDIITGKMYITGAVGSTHVGEAFTVPYDLPNDTAYTETCASIALAFFTNRMLQHENKAKYAEICERALYNGMLSGLSLDGKGFFYENPLEINLAKFRRNTSTKSKDRFPITRRPEVFGCSCCPPNINRVLASIGNFIYGVEGKGDAKALYINQYVPSTLDFDGIKAELKTGYPYVGHSEIKVCGVGKVMIRIPSWAKNVRISESYVIVDGYACIENEEKTITVDFDIVPRLIKSSPLVWDNCGKAALMVGPMVYCAEEIDNAAPLHTLMLSKNLEDADFYDDEALGVRCVRTKGYIQKPCETLYTDVDSDSSSICPEETTIKLIPYHAFANRKECDMAVWITLA